MENGANDTIFGHVPNISYFGQKKQMETDVNGTLQGMAGALKHGDVKVFSALVILLTWFMLLPIIIQALIVFGTFICVLAYILGFAKLASASCATGSQDSRPAVTDPVDPVSAAVVAAQPPLIFDIFSEPGGEVPTDSAAGTDDHAEAADAAAGCRSRTPSPQYGTAPHEALGVSVSMAGFTQCGPSQRHASPMLLDDNATNQYKDFFSQGVNHKSLDRAPQSELFDTIAASSPPHATQCGPLPRHASPERLAICALGQSEVSTSQGATHSQAAQCGCLPWHTSPGRLDACTSGLSKDFHLQGLDFKSQEFASLSLRSGLDVVAASMSMQAAPCGLLPRHASPASQPKDFTTKGLDFKSHELATQLGHQDFAAVTAPLQATSSGSSTGHASPVSLDASASVPPKDFTTQGFDFKSQDLAPQSELFDSIAAGSPPQATSKDAGSVGTLEVESSTPSATADSPSVIESNIVGYSVVSCDRARQSGLDSVAASLSVQATPCRPLPRHAPPAVLDANALSPPKVSIAEGLEFKSQDLADIPSQSKDFVLHGMDLKSQELATQSGHQDSVAAAAPQQATPCGPSPRHASPVHLDASASSYHKDFTTQGFDFKSQHLAPQPVLFGSFATTSPPQATSKVVEVASSAGILGVESTTDPSRLPQTWATVIELCAQLQARVSDQGIQSMARQIQVVAQKKSHDAAASLQEKDAAASLLEKDAAQPFSADFEALESFMTSLEDSRPKLWADEYDIDDLDAARVTDISASDISDNVKANISDNGDNGKPSRRRQRKKRK